MDTPENQDEISEPGALTIPRTEPANTWWVTLLLTQLDELAAELVLLENNLEIAKQSIKNQSTSAGKSDTRQSNSHPQNQHGTFWRAAAGKQDQPPARQNNTRPPRKGRNM